MPPLLRLITPGLLLALAGCSTLSQEECQSSDWYSLGYQDGQAGKLQSQLQRYTQSCGEYGLHPDTARWQSGYAKGLEYYCIPELAYAKGKAGEEYQGVCPNDASFRARYQQGRREYLIAQELHDIDQHLRQLRAERDQLYSSYRQSGDDTLRREIRARLEQLDWMELDLRRHRLEVQSQQLE
ncbi:MAG: DUF2799 domain-containing protein [Aeromonadaceae bacterium]